MSRDQTTALYRWLIGGMVAIIAYFAIKIDKKVDQMYDSFIQQHHVDVRQDDRITRLELDVKDLHKQQQTFLSSARSTTHVN